MLRPTRGYGGQFRPCLPSPRLPLRHGLLSHARDPGDPSTFLRISSKGWFLSVAGRCPHVRPVCSSGGSLPRVRSDGPRCTTLSVSSGAAVCLSSLSQASPITVRQHEHYYYAVYRPSFLTQPLPSAFMMCRWIRWRNANCTRLRYLRSVKHTICTRLNTIDHFIFEKLDIFYMDTPVAPRFGGLAVSCRKLSSPTLVLAQ